MDKSSKPKQHELEPRPNNRKTGPNKNVDKYKPKNPDKPKKPKKVKKKLTPEEIAAKKRKKKKLLEKNYHCYHVDEGNQCTEIFEIWKLARNHMIEKHEIKNPKLKRSTVYINKPTKTNLKTEFVIKLEKEDIEEDCKDREDIEKDG